MENYKKDKKKKTKKRKPKKNWYLTQEHEDAIVEYANSNCRKKKEEIFSKIIGPTFEDLINKVVYTYKFTDLPNIENMKADCAAHMSLILDKFDPNKGSKAFSYFTVVIKNWFFAEKKKYYRKMQQECLYEDLSLIDDADLYDENHFEEIREKEEFWDHLLKEFSYWEQDLSNTASDLLVYRAIRLLFEYVDEIEVMTQRSAYEYIRRITGLETKEISEALKKLRMGYADFKDAWDSGEI